MVSGDESSLLLNAASTVARPVFTEYQASAFGNVKLVVHDCPVWKSYLVHAHYVPQTEGAVLVQLKGSNLQKN
ncbi:Rho related BTB domain containing 3 [Homo sapiens]|nr:Rho related BTB domain containing 3 [Homo sapiens]KAI4022058.1 Rho related BTB domain containing 3 [Homo sapiens]